MWGEKQLKKLKVESTFKFSSNKIILETLDKVVYRLVPYIRFARMTS